MTQANSSYKRIQREADDYAETTLCYFKSDSPDLPALPDAEKACFETVRDWLDMHWELPSGIRDEIAGAALGHAREEYGTFWGDDALLVLNDV